jgi:L-fuconolactonase
MTVIDAHQHFWELGRFDYDWLNDPPLKPIRRTYLPPDLEPHLRATGVEKSIFVQTQHNVVENDWVLQLCEQYDFLAGMVGWVDLASPHCEEQLLKYKSNPYFVGVRHVTHDEPDDDFIVRNDVIRGLRILEKHRVPFDLLFFVKHLKHAPTLGKALPDLPMVIDHLAKPKIKHGSLNGWEADFRAAAKFPNIYCKISGMVTEANWTGWKPADLRPYVEIALDAFGPERCMVGSDWPVCELAGTYQQVYGAAREVLSSLSAAEQSTVFGGTAAKFYGI